MLKEKDIDLILNKINNITDNDKVSDDLEPVVLYEDADIKVIKKTKKRK